MSPTVITFLIIGSVIISIGIMITTLKMSKSKIISDKSKIEKIEFFTKLKSLWAMEVIFLSIGIVLLFVFFPMKVNADSMFNSVMSIIALIYVLICCILSRLKYNKFKVYYIEFINRK